MTRDEFEAFVDEASDLFDFELEVWPNTECHMIASDHGYAEYVIAPIRSASFECNAVLIVEDAGETQRRFTLIVLDEFEVPSMFSHSYFKE